jgi:hypothetical protein
MSMFAPRRPIRIRPCLAGFGLGQPVMSPVCGQQSTHWPFKVAASV